LGEKSPRILGQKSISRSHPGAPAPLDRWIYFAVLLRVSIMSPQSLLSPLSLDDRGASMVEYALLASLIAVGAISSVASVGREVRNTFVEAAALGGVDDLVEDDRVTIP
jgi:Flp pilus assembly pilin Flp